MQSESSEESRRASAAVASVPTQWTLVVLARGSTPQAREALASLCEIYYQPVLQFLRREGRPPDVALELAQEFFARILSGSGFAGAAKEQGRFRSYLLGALKHFLADARAREQRLKRGAGIAPVSLDACQQKDTAAESGRPEPSVDPDERSFDREWAMAVMLRATNALESEFKTEGKADQFQLLKWCLVGDGSGFSLSEVSRQLSISEPTLRVTVHRFRKRFRDLVRGEIGQTLRDPDLVDEELHHLIQALSAQ